MAAGRMVAVFGAYGRTGRFVVAELGARGFVPVLSGRDEARLRDLGASRPDLPVRPATADDAAALDRALAGADAVINCAGPFAATSPPVLEAALRAGIPYLDVTAEVEVTRTLFDQFDDRARAAGVAAIPAMAFYGGLGDLLVTAAMGDWAAADEAHIAFGLDSWHPTAGTRNTLAAIVESSGGRRACYSGGQLEFRDGDQPVQKWEFPEPLGVRTVIGEFNLADAVTVPSHLAIPTVCGYLTVEAATDVTSPDTPPPAPVDEHGRSAQTFVVDVAVRSAGTERRASARGQDAYAVTAPLVVEAVQRVLAGQGATPGVASAGARFDGAFLRSLSAHLALDLP